MWTGGLFDPTGAGGGEKEQDVRDTSNPPSPRHKKQKSNLIRAAFIIIWANLKLALLQVLCT